MKTFVKSMTFATLIIAMMVVAACQKDANLSPTESTSSNPKYLEFKSFDEFQLLVSKIGKMSESEIDSYDNSRTGFTSMRKMFHQAMIDEEKNYDMEGVQNKTSHTKSELLVRYPQLAVEMAEGGYELNLADSRMAVLLNADGMVHIGDYIHQYTKQFNKVIRDLPNQTNEVQLLKTKTADDPSIGLMVGKNRAVKETPNAKVSGDVYASRSCDVYDNGSSPKNYRLIVYEESILMEQPVGAYSVVNITSSVPTVGPNKTISYTNITYPIITQTNRVYYSIHQLKVRTLKRSTFGSWTDCQSGMQTVSGNFELQGTLTYSYSAFGVLTSPIVYTNIGTDGAVITTFTVVLAESQKFPTVSDAQNVRFKSSATHTGNWSKDGRTCTCVI